MRTLIRINRLYPRLTILIILLSITVSLANQRHTITPNAIIDPFPGQSVGNQEIAYLGEASSDLAGYSISDLGDFNNDGYNDFLIFSKGPNFEGKTHLVFGREDINLTASYSLSQTDASFIGSAANQIDTIFTTQDMISGIGDVNADGYDDFVIGSPQNDEAGADAGKTYIVLGGENDWGHDVSVNSVNASIFGEVAGGQLGFWVSGVGNVNNDLYDDFIISAPGASKGGASSNGAVYLILGRQTSQWQLDSNIFDVANASYFGAKNSDTLGYPLAGVGDVNNDNFDDFLMRSANNGVGTLSEAHLVLGKTSWVMDQNISLTADASFTPKTLLDDEITSLNGIGDINGDNHDDFAIGLYNVGGGQGATYIFFGETTPQWTKNTVLDNSVITTLHGEDTNQLFGFRVSPGGDINTDGIDDFLVSSLNYPGLANGRVYAIFGDANWAYRNITVDLDLTFTGEVSGDYLGADIVGVGDVNGDGKDDLLMSAPLNQEITTFSGKIYLYMNPYDKPQAVTETEFSTTTTTETTLIVSFETTTLTEQDTETTTFYDTIPETVSEDGQLSINLISVVILLIFIPAIRRNKYSQK